MAVRSLKLLTTTFPPNFWRDEIANRWDYQDFLDHPEWGRDWISFDGVVFHAASNRVYCGLTCFDGDILYAWDVAEQRFLSLGFDRVMDRYDAKFHRAMELSKDGKSLYLATALLHDVDRFFEAPGGGIYRHDLVSGENEKLGIPLPHNYIQSSVLDEERGVLYNMHFTPECLSVFDLQTRKGRSLGPISGGMQMAQGENLVLDDQGGVWCGWCATKAWHSTMGTDIARLCKYDPDAGKILYFPHGLPNPDGSHGFTRVEGLFNLGTGMLYASGGNGSLFRIDPKTGKSAFLGTPITNERSRLTSLVLHPDGHAYGITGRDGNCRLLRFDPRTDTYEVGDAIRDDEGNAMFQCHDICVSPEGTLFAGENDHPSRSSYLWEITL
ncbi:MAG: hypothetical protein IAE94_06705 [Chthoniobacterales bacterium]|nr:hypothetical protein [Chthoniobacterales bacterium]